RVRVDQARGDQRATEILDLVDIDDVVDYPGQAGRQLVRGASPGDPVILHQDRCIADYFSTSPQSTDIGEKAYHRQAPRFVRACCVSSLPFVMVTPCLIA